MARLQILELPTEHHGDDMVTPFVLVIDQHEPPPFPVDVDAPGPFDHIAEKIGARAVLAFEETVDIIAPGAPDVAHGEGPSCTDVPDCDGGCCAPRNVEKELKAASEVIKRLTADREEARMWARHGYEIGQKHCGWTDHGVAPDWLTEGWPPHIDNCEHLQQMAEFDEALTRVRNLPTEPEVMNAAQEHPSVWRHGYHCGVLAAKAAARPRDEPTVKP